ncbi:MAG: alcohol dehydrogenase catalytic domain-containing protein [Spirochaetales bacterium]|nr:alcohol dehydrogenase catalytic domain-containing protein [Spirochaetales bacterium]
MKAVYFENGTLSLREIPVPEPAEGEAFIRVLQSGICNTDIELYRGYYGFSGVPGHEFVGLVERVNAADRSLEGRRVCADINIGCGSCPRCLSGDSRHCPQKRTIGINDQQGVFAEYVILPIANLSPVPEEVTDDEAVYAEPLAAALEIGQQIHLTAQDRIAVLGDGKLGLLCAFALAVYSPRITLVGRHEKKLKVASDYGIETLMSGTTDLSAQFDMVVEATGSETGIRDALALVRPEGTVVVKTTSHKPSEIDLAKLVVDEIRLVGSRCGSIPLALSTLAKKLVPVTSLTEAVYPLEDFEQAFEHARKKGTLKILLKHPDA